MATELQERDMLQAQATVFVWHQVFAPSAEKSVDFYTQALGWTTQDYPMGEMGTYKMLVANGRPVAGVVSTDACEGHENIPPHWSVSIGVDDVDARLDKCKTLGATVLAEPMDIPTVGRMALVQDPQGASFWLFTPEGGC